jgi:hypothetical protein
MYYEWNNQATTYEFWKTAVRLITETTIRGEEARRLQPLTCRPEPCPVRAVNASTGLQCAALPSPAQDR